MSERFSDRLYRLARPIWEAQHSHPFVRGIGEGSLDIEKFKFWCARSTSSSSTTPACWP